MLECSARPIRRETLAEIFWPGFTEATARHSLRNALYHLRKLVAPLDLLDTTHQTVQFDVSHPEFWCDALAFQALEAEIDDASSSGDQSKLRQALSLYRAEFLAGLQLWGCPEFDAWQLAWRDRFAKQAKQLARTLDAAVLRRRPTPRRGWLPRPLTPFFGREAELETLARKRLNLQAETVFRLEGLLVPDGRAGLPAATDHDWRANSYSSLRLFAERAERVAGDFTLSTLNQDDVVRICQLVEGVPLAIELAAALVDEQL